MKRKTGMTHNYNEDKLLDLIDRKNKKEKKQWDTMNYMINTGSIDIS